MKLLIDLFFKKPSASEIRSELYRSIGIKDKRKVKALLSKLTDDDLLNEKKQKSTGGRNSLHDMAIMRWADEEIILLMLKKAKGLLSQGYRNSYNSNTPLISALKSYGYEVAIIIVNHSYPYSGRDEDFDIIRNWRPFPGYESKHALLIDAIEMKLADERQLNNITHAGSNLHCSDHTKKSECKEFILSDSPERSDYVSTLTRRRVHK